MASFCSGVRSSPSTPVRSDGTSVRSGANQARAEGTDLPRVGAAARSCPAGFGLRGGGRWSEVFWQFLASLAAAKARFEPELMRKSTF